MTGGQAVGRSGGQDKDAGPLSLTGPPLHQTAEPPFVLIIEERGVPRVAAANAAAARRGVAIGMAVAEAKAFAGDLVAQPWDDERIARAALEVTTALLAASPRVAWERGQGVWWVDAAGLGDERRLGRKLATLAAALRFGVTRAGIADSAIAAYAATIAVPKRTPARPYVVVPSGRDAAFLAPLPIALLDLDDDFADTLRALGLTTVGRLAALDPGEVESRFGLEGLTAWRLARGIDARGPTTPRDDALPVVEVELGGPVSTAEPLLFVLRGALASLSTALRDKGLAARELTIGLSLDDGSRAERAVRPARPTSHADVLLDHCRAALDDWTLEEPVVGLSLAATLTVPAAGEQGNLLAPRWADPAALEAAFDRIRGREGSDAVAIPVARDGHLPEDAGAFVMHGVSVRDREPKTENRKPFSTALRRLTIAAPARVRLGRAGLEAFKHDDTWHDVAAWSGPERLTPRWWHTGAGPRDYYMARTTTGACWLLYRSARERAWFVEGWLD